MFVYLSFDLLAFTYTINNFIIKQSTTFHSLLLRKLFITSYVPQLMAVDGTFMDILVNMPLLKAAMPSVYFMYIIDCNTFL